MGLPVEVNNLMLGSLGGYTVGRSLRFRSSASAYLNRTLTTPTNNKIWTFSTWLKRGQLNIYAEIFSAGSNNSVFMFNKDISDALQYYEYNGSTLTTDLRATALFRDPSAWYHLVLAVDTTQATASNRVKMYVNGAQITSFTTATYPSQNASTYWNSAIAHYLGVEVPNSRYFDGYLAEVNFIDGQQLTPSSFGAYDTNGVWQPKKYSGTYGTNGFYLPFDNTSSIAGGNICTYSEDISNGAYVKNNATVTTNSTTAPNGTTTADTLTEDTANSTHRYYNPIGTTTNGVTYTFSVYAKANTRSAIALEGWNGSTVKTAYADLSNGTIISGSDASAAIVSVGNGWYRISVSHTGVGLSGSSIGVYLMNAASSSAYTYTGNGSGSVYLWGNQVEAASSVGPYFPTQASTISSTSRVGLDSSTNASASAGYGNHWAANNIDVVSNNYRSFTTVGTYGWTAPAGVTSVNYLVVGGGGGGGGSSPNYVSGGGGGGGGVLSGTLSVTPGTTYTVTVGAGGAAGAGALGGNGGNGGNSVFATLTAIGGGGGGAYTAGPSTGGSGGGGANNGAGQAGAAGTSGQGNAGGNAGTYFNSTSSQGGGGGGGAGAAGSNFNGLNGGAGGAGIASTITGSTVYYGGGGGGGAANGTGGAAGSGGGGAGGSGNSSGGASGAANTGGGGGGASTQLSGSPTGGAGGSGVVIISYSGALQAGTTYDSMIDSPTNAAGTSTGIGNYAVLNPLYSAGGGTFSNGNLQVATGTSTAGRAIATMGVSSGKWYWEITPTSIPANVVSIGFVPNPTTNESGTVGNNASEYGYLSDGQKFSGGSASAYGASYVANDVIGVALDLDAGTLVFYKNGTSQGTAYSSIPLTNTYVPAVSDSSSSNSGTFVANFGQRPFSYTPPSGFKALNTYNLPAPSIANGAQYMAATVFSASGSSQVVTNTVNNTSFQTDFLWLKNRTSAGNHYLADVIRGPSNLLYSDATSAEGSAPSFITSFNSNGFTINTNGVYTNGNSIVGWQWKAGGTGVTNTAGTITSTVSASSSSGFSIATYSGNGTNGATVGHGLGVKPDMIIIKGRNASTGSSQWICQHVSLSGGVTANSSTFTLSGYTQAIYLNLTNAAASYAFDAQVNGASGTYVAYCFSAVSGYSAFGKYTGNGSADGPFIYTGFRPRWVMIKNTQDGTTNWYIYDTSRDTYNIMSNYLMSNLSNAEASFSAMDYLSNGFKIRTSNLNFNNSGQTHIYAAFAESPFQISRAR